MIESGTTETLCRVLYTEETNPQIFGPVNGNIRKPDKWNVNEKSLFSFFSIDP